MDSAVERLWREELMAEISARAAAGDGTLSRDALTRFSFAGQELRLVDESRGIRNPQGLGTTLSIVHNPSGPYRDHEVSPGVWEYAYQKGSIEGSNTKLRRAGELEMPLVFLLKLETSVFVPVSLAYVIRDDPTRRVFTIALADVAVLREPLHPSVAERGYAERVVRQRLHQPAFRGLVLRAYERQCSICTLKHAELLDAAHIVPDSDPRGVPTTPNGLALCKIHHAAFDQQIVGVTPDYRVQVRTDVLAEVDGPMLKHGIQEMHGRTLTLPRRAADRPDRELLAWRWERFAGR